MKGLLQFKHKEQGQQGQINIELLEGLHNLLTPFILHLWIIKANVKYDCPKNVRWERSHRYF